MDWEAVEAKREIEAEQFERSVGDKRPQNHNGCFSSILYLVLFIVLFRLLILTVAFLTGSK
jgi:hypothetical protein